MSTITPEATFIEGTRGALFAVHRPARSMDERAECLLVVPSFAEEMNRCRYMCTLLAQACAELPGTAVLTVDPYGTGDSAGEFGDADWRQWGYDLRTAIDYARGLGYARVSLLAIRLGALLAFENLSHCPDVRRVLLWQPVINGKSALTQFMRLRVAAAAGRGESGESTASLTAQIDAGQSIDIAGYEVSPGLFNGINASRLDQHLDAPLPPIAWFTTLPSDDRQPSRGDLKLIETLRSRGIAVDHRIAHGPSYWQVHERTLAPALIEATVTFLRETPLGES